MKTRLGVFIFCLLLLPITGYWLSGKANGLSANSAATMPTTRHVAATLLTTFALSAYILLANHLTRLRTGNSPLSVQGRYFLVMGIASAVLGWLLVYLNYFAASWWVESGDPKSGDPKSGDLKSGNWGRLVCVALAGVRRENFPPKKKFPISVVVKKS